MRLLVIYVFLSGLTFGQYNHVQIMHNSADTSVKHLKLWVNDTVWVPAFDYLDATPQVLLPSGQVHTLGVSVPGATSQAQCIAQTTLDNTSANYAFAFLAVVGIHDPGPQYNPGSTLKPFGFYTYLDSSIIGEPSPVDCRLFLSHLSTDVASLTVISGTTTFASALGYKNTNDHLLFGMAQTTNGFKSFTVSVSSPSGSIGSGTMTLQGGKKICVVSTGFIDTLANARVAGGGKRLVLGALPVQGGKVTEIPLKVATTADLGELSFAELPRLYPSPATDRVFVEMGNADQVQVVLFDLLGNRIRSTALAGTVGFIDVGDLPAGVYFVSIDNGHMIHKSKIVIE